MFKIIRATITAVITSFFILITTTAFAGGLYLSEFGTPSMGVAGAGSQAVASDASTAWHNPAGMTRLDGKQLMFTGGVLKAMVKFDRDSDTPPNRPAQIWHQYRHDFGNNT
jgi:long-subunit fatty acid transport protein